MNWLKRKLEIRKLRKLEREKLWEMMRVSYMASCESPAGSRAEQRLEREVDEIRARISELRGDI